MSVRQVRVPGLRPVPGKPAAKPGVGVAGGRLGVRPVLPHPLAAAARRDAAHRRHPRRLQVRPLTAAETCKLLPKGARGNPGAFAMHSSVVSWVPRASSSQITEHVLPRTPLHRCLPGGAASKPGRRAVKRGYRPSAAFSDKPPPVLIPQAGSVRGAPVGGRAAGARLRRPPPRDRVADRRGPPAARRPGGRRSVAGLGLRKHGRTAAWRGR